MPQALPDPPARSRREICRFGHGDLLYRVYFFEDGEIAFTVTGDTLRLGLVTLDDLRWDWDWMKELPMVQETARAVNIHAGSLHVLRTVALRLGQYLGKHQPPFFYYRVEDDPRRRRLYARLLFRCPRVACRYQALAEAPHPFVMFTRTSKDDSFL